MLKVSVIIPTYNHRNYIGPAIDSVLHQTFIDYEIIVADDASSDGTSDIVREYAEKWPDKVRAVVGDTRKGIAGNINRGLNIAAGEYVAWLGGDDLMHPTKLEEQVQFLDAHPDIAGCHHDAELYDQSLGSVVGRFSELCSLGSRQLVQGDIGVLFDSRAPMLPSTMMFRRSHAYVGGFDQRLRYSNDWLFDIETFKNGRIGSIDKVLGVYRRHGGNVTASADLAQITLEENMMVLGITQARHPELTPLIKKRKRAFLLAEMIKQYRAGQRAVSYHFMVAASLEGAYLRSPVLFLVLLLVGNGFFQRFDIKAYGNKQFVRKVRNVLRL